MATFKFDENMIEQGVRASLANYYQALLIREKDESKAKQLVCKLLRDIESEYSESAPDSQESSVERV